MSQDVEPSVSAAIAIIGSLAEIFPMLEDPDAGVSILGISQQLTPWVEFYELPLLEHIAFAGIHFRGALDVFNQTDGLSGPDMAVALAADIDNKFKLSDGVSKGEAAAFGYSLFRTLKALSLYGRSINQMLAMARTEPGVSSFFDAVRCDRAVLTGPTGSDLITSAQAAGDDEFFRELSKAFSGPSKQLGTVVSRVRLGLLVLIELRLPGLNPQLLVEIFVNRLGFYADHPSAEKNLWAQYQTLRKSATV